jgi:hypothetical protein
VTSVLKGFPHIDGDANVAFESGAPEKHPRVIGRKVFGTGILTQPGI